MVKDDKKIKWTQITVDGSIPQGHRPPVCFPPRFWKHPRSLMAVSVVGLFVCLFVRFFLSGVIDDGAERALN